MGKAIYRAEDATLTIKNPYSKKKKKGTVDNLMFCQKYHEIGKPKKELAETKERRNKNNTDLERAIEAKSYEH